MIYHITTREAWEAAAEDYRADSLTTQGFIHFSDREQVLKVARAVYQDVPDLVVLVVDPARLHGELRYEPPDPSIPAEHYDGERFPHLYASLNIDAVVNVVPFTADADNLPDGV